MKAIVEIGSSHFLFHDEYTALVLAVALKNSTILNRNYSGVKYSVSGASPDVSITLVDLTKETIDGYSEC